MKNKLFNLADQRTQMLFIKAEQLINICWLSAILSMICLSIFLFGYKSMDSSSKLLLVSISIFFFLLVFLTRRYLLRHIFVEIRKRCSELPSIPASLDTIQEYAKKKKWRLLGSLLFLFWIPFLILAEFIGLPVIKQDHSNATFLGWVISISLIILGLFLVLYGATCPACKKIGILNRRTKTCAQCGAHLEIDKNKS